MFKKIVNKLKRKKEIDPEAEADIEDGLTPSKWRCCEEPSISSQFPILDTDNLFYSRTTEEGKNIIRINGIVKNQKTSLEIIIPTTNETRDQIVVNENNQKSFDILDGPAVYKSIEKEVVKIITAHSNSSRLYSDEEKLQQVDSDQIKCELQKLILKNFPLTTSEENPTSPESIPSSSYRPTPSQILDMKQYSSPQFPSTITDDYCIEQIGHQNIGGENSDCSNMDQGFHY